MLTDPAGREAALIRRRDAPGPPRAHAEHLLPLMVAAGAAQGEARTRIFADRLLGKPVSGFRFGAPVADAEDRSRVGSRLAEPAL